MSNERALKLAAEIRHCVTDLDDSLRGMLSSSGDLPDAIYELRHQLEATDDVTGKTIVSLAVNVLHAELKICAMRMELEQLTRRRPVPEFG